MVNANKIVAMEMRKIYGWGGQTVQMIIRSYHVMANWPLVVSLYRYTIVYS